MKKLVVLLAALLVFALAATATAAGPRPKRGDVVNAPQQAYNAAWVTGTSADGGAKGTSIMMSSIAPDIAYYAFRNWWDHRLAAVKKIEAFWKLSAVNAGGSPRFSLEVASGGVATGEVIYLDPAWCSDPAPGGSAAGWVVSDFTGDRTNCTIWDSNGNSYSSDAAGTAWSKVVAAYPGYTVWFLYAIQDASNGTNYLDRVKLDSAFFT